MLNFRSLILDYLLEMQISPYMLISNSEFILATQGGLLKLLENWEFLFAKLVILISLSLLLEWKSYALSG